MKYAHSTAIAFGTVMLAFALPSFSQVNTTTGLRCFYKLNQSTSKPETAYKEAKTWAGHYGTPISGAAPFQGQPYVLEGYWRYDGQAGSNMFYTRETQARLRTICEDTFKKEKIDAPVEMFVAANSERSFNYTIWSIDRREVKPSDKINKIIAFGDSITDTQNLYNGSSWKMPNSKSFFLGRFSNGRVWLDYLEHSLNLPAYNWSTGAAAAKDFYTFIPGINSQVQSWVEYTDKKYAKNYQPEDTLFTMLIGANDMKSHERNPSLIIAEQRNALETIIAHGGRHILLGNLPDVSRSPAAQFMDQSVRDHIHQQTIEYDKQLSALAAELQRKYQDKKVNIQLFDIYGLFNEILDNKNGVLTNTKESCLDLKTDTGTNYLVPNNLRSGCTDADSYAFWDLLHPTTRVHNMLADKAYCFIKSKYGSKLILTNKANTSLPRCEAS